MSYGLSEISIIQGQVSQLVDRYPHLKNTKLVVEGAVGKGSWTIPSLARTVFHDALYVGTDIDPEILPSYRFGRQRGSVQPEVLELLQERQEYLNITDVPAPTILANCFDGPLVTCLINWAAGPVVLGSLDAMGALMDRKMNPEDNKNPADKIAVEDWFDACPYQAYLFLTRNPYYWDTKVLWQREHKMVEQVAKERGFAVEKMMNGLAVVRTNIA